MTRLIVNADDFGLTPGVNAGIVEAFQHGIVTSTTLMVNMPAFEDALALMRDNPGLGVGIHLVLTAGRPILADVPSLVDTDGAFRKVDAGASHARPEDVRREFTAQMERFLSAGNRPTHIDSHHHVHNELSLQPVVLELAEQYGLPVRAVNAPRPTYPWVTGVKGVSFFSAAFYGAEATFDGLHTILKEAARYETAEIMTHPAFADDALRACSRYARERDGERIVLTDARWPALLEALDMKLSTYRDL